MEDKLTAEEYCKKLDNQKGEIWSNDYELLPKYMQEFAEYYHQSKLSESDLVSRRELLEWMKTELSDNRITSKAESFNDLPVHNRNVYLEGQNEGFEYGAEWLKEKVISHLTKKEEK